MSRVSQTSLADACLAQVRIAPVGIDDWSLVRYVHKIAFEKLVAPWLDAERGPVFLERVASPDYVDDLMRENLAAAWFDGQLVGTCGWQPADDSGAVARVTSLFVHPLFTRMGFGRALLRHSEECAANAGFRMLTLRATGSSLLFFAASRYEISSYGVAALVGGEADMPVIFMRKLLEPADLTVIAEQR